MAERPTLHAPTRRSVVVAWLLAVLACGGFQLCYGDHNLNLRDEGYLWYGVVRVLAGEFPLLDFQAYDPGRYYWCAAFSPLFGDGIVGVRAAVAVFETLGVACGLLVARRFLRHDAWLAPVTLLLVLWMFPRHKLFEPALTLIAMLFVTRLVERPCARRFLAFGLLVGLAAVVGRNHGLYLALVAVAVSALLALRAAQRPGPRELGAGALGVLLGYLPMLVLLASVSGYAAAFWEAVVSVGARGANIPLGYRWPWLGGGDEELGTLTALALDAAYLLPPLALATGLLAVLRARGADLHARAPLVAATLVGLAYVHHYAVRSDLPHLAQGYPPVLFAALALASRRPAVAGVALTLLLALSVPVALEGHTELKPLAPGRAPERRVEVEVRGETLSLKPAQAALVRRVRAAVEREVGDQQLFVAPTMPMWYPLLGKRSPTWWIYFLWPATEAEQHETIRRLAEQDVRFALIIDKPFNDLAEYNFEHTNPLVWRHLTEAWRSVPAPELPPSYRLFRRLP